MNKGSRHQRSIASMRSALVLFLFLVVACPPEKSPNPIANIALPPQPELNAWPIELGDRIRETEDRIRRDEDSVEALISLSGLYHANGFYSEASQCYLGLIQLQPDQPKWPYRLDALPFWEASSQLAPSNEPAFVRLGDAYLKNNDLDKADRAYDTVLSMNPKNPYALMGKGRIAIGQQNWTEAISHLNAAGLHSNSRIGTDLLVSVYEITGESQKAADIRENVTTYGLFFDFDDPWIQEILLDSYDPHQIAVAAGKAKHAENTALAIRLLNRGISVSPKDGHLRLELGMIFVANNQLTEALSQLQECVAVAPKIEEGWSMLSSLYRLRGDAAQADRVLMEGLQHCPDSPGLRLGKARRLNQFGKTKEALAEYEIVFSLYLEEAEPFVEAALLYFQIGQTSEGFRAIEKALEAEPNFPPALVEMTRHKIISKDQEDAARWLSRITHDPGINPNMIQEMQQLFKKTFNSRPPNQ